MDKEQIQADIEEIKKNPTKEWSCAFALELAQTALDVMDENKKLRTIVTEMQRALEDDPSLKLDIYGMAFYADTGLASIQIDGSCNGW